MFSNCNHKIVQALTSDSLDTVWQVKETLVLREETLVLRAPTSMQTVRTKIWEYRSIPIFMSDIEISNTSWYDRDNTSIVASDIKTYSKHRYWYQDFKSWLALSSILMTHCMTMLRNSLLTILHGSKVNENNTLKLI